MTADPFSVPSGAGAGLEDLLGRLVVFTDITIRENMPNPFGGDPRDEADAAITVLDGPGAPLTRAKQPIFGTRLVRQCKARAEVGFVFGRVGSTDVKGRDVLELEPVDPAAVQVVRDWVTANLRPGNQHGSPPAAVSAPQPSAPAPEDPWAPAGAAQPAQAGQAAQPPF